MTQESSSILPFPHRPRRNKLRSHVHTQSPTCRRYRHDFASDGCHASRRNNRTDSQGRLFSDPYAELLAGGAGLKLRADAIAASEISPRLRYGHLKSPASSRGVRQIVMLAAGMDTRAYRLALSHDTHVFELDRKEVLDYKQAKLLRTQPQCTRTAIAVILRDDWPAALRQAGLRASTRRSG